MDVLFPPRGWRRERSSRIVQTSKGFIDISFIGRDCAFITLHGDDGWPANRLGRPIRPDERVVDRALRRLGVPAEEAATLATQVIADWPHERKPVKWILVSGVVGWIFSLIGAGAAARRLLRALR